MQIVQGKRCANIDKNGVTYSTKEYATGENERRPTQRDFANYIPGLRGPGTRATFQLLYFYCAWLQIVF